jgi:hypothetical protein
MAMSRCTLNILADFGGLGPQRPCKRKERGIVMSGAVRPVLRHISGTTSARGFFFGGGQICA